MSHSRFPIDDDPLWFKNSVIYQLYVRSFRDSDGDGVGDFKGLAEKLDYLEDLGVTAIWILPFYPSPMRDGGYDIADYTGVHADYGNVKDVKNLVTAAHERGIRVLNELVINHTSDQHAWFQRARRAKPGSKERDYYMWNDSPDRYDNVRIIFQDFESSNWAWDPVAKAYYWHRFYSHQPDLNFDSPHVHDEVFKVLEFWLKMGFDGMRLDAIPYLYARDGTSCENLPETHQFLKKLRKQLDSKYKDRMLLAEANMWPEDAVAYFGDGDECHMNFHFPLMPRMFMALHMENRFPIIDILDQTPAIPDNCQWALFLRNHDELTLEMVTDEERDYMYRVYARDPRARINLGIRRRLAPLLRNNRRKIELLNGLLFSLPGTPIIYYGDEIGMGDNIYLGDRDGVRTPMQWSADRNAGFSDANPHRLYLPVNIDPEYRYESVNVEAQQQNPHSLLWWMKRLIALRHQHPVFGTGKIEVLNPDNPKVLSFLRSDAHETVLVVANLSRFSQYVELDLQEYEGCIPVEMFGSTPFPRIGELTYLLTLAPHSFYWFLLTREAPVEIDTEAPSQFQIAGSWPGILESRQRTRLEGAISRALPSRSWFRSRGRTFLGAKIVDVMPVGKGTDCEAHLLLLEVEFTEGEPESYTLPVLAYGGERGRTGHGGDTTDVLVKLTDGHYPVVVDATKNAEFYEVLIKRLTEKRPLESQHGVIELSEGLAQTLKKAKSEPVRVSADTHDNALVHVGEVCVLKLFHQAEVGANPEEELVSHLSRTAKFDHVPEFKGAVRHKCGRDQRTLSVVQTYIPNQGSAWDAVFGSLAPFLEDALAWRTPPALPEGSPIGTHRKEDDAIDESLVPHRGFLGLLGQRTGEMHRALASEEGNGALTPEKFGPHYQRSLYQSIRNQTRSAMSLLRRRTAQLDPASQILALRLSEGEEALHARIRPLVDIGLMGQRLRVHGDFHLGQVLYTGRDFVFIDFEGDVARPLSERRLKRSPLQDVASMIRSFEYVLWAAMGHQQERWESHAAERSERLHVAARVWLWHATHAYWHAYEDATAESRFLPQERVARLTLMDAFLLENALYGLEYELLSRPQWVHVAMQALLDALESPPLS